MISGTVFSDRRTTSGTRKDRTWSQWCTALQAPKEYPSKDAMPLVKFGIFRDDSRASGSELESLSAVVGDYDAGTVSVEEAAQRLTAADIASLLYTSASHTSERPHWRVVAPLSAPISPGEYRELMDLLNGALGGILAPESWEPKRCYYFGRVRGVEYRHVMTDGETLDAHALIGTSWLPVRKPGAQREPAKLATAAEAPATRSPLSPQKLAELIAHYKADGERHQIWNDAEPEWTRWVWDARDATRGDEHAKAMCRELSERSAEKWDPAAFEDRWSRKEGSHVLRVPCTRADFDDLTKTDPFEESDVAKRAAKIERYKFASPSELLARPMPTWIIEGILPQQDLAALYGPGGVGKSFLALDLSLAIARGVSWFGRDVLQGRVCWVASEAAGSFRPRLEAYLRRHEIPVSEIEERFRVLGTAINLTDTEEMRVFADAARQHAPTLVVIDTLAASMTGNESSTEDMLPVLANCRAIHEATGALVLLLHHAGKDPTKGLRGSSSIYAAMHAVIAVRELDAEAGTREIETEKMRDGEAGPHTRAAFRLVPVDVGRDAKDRPVRSAVVHHLGAAPKRGPKLSPQRQLAFDVLEDHGSDWMTSDEAGALVAAELPAPEAGKRDRRRLRANESLRWLCQHGLAERDGDRVRVKESASDLRDDG